MGFNKKVLSQIKSDLNSAKAPARKKDIIVDPAGQWKYPGQTTRIPSSQITMQGVDYPVFAQPNIGQPQMMYPGQEYNFPGADYVDEYPQMKKGGQKKYSRSLEATNKLFTANPYVKKKKSKKKKIFNPNAKYYQDGGESRSEELLGVIPVNSGRKTLRDWTYGESIGMLQEEDGGYIELDLTPEEIEEYKRGGYVVEDISVPSLNRFDKGGEKNKKKKRKTKEDLNESSTQGDIVEAIETEVGLDPNLTYYKGPTNWGDRLFAKDASGSWYSIEAGQALPFSYDPDYLNQNTTKASDEEALGRLLQSKTLDEVTVTGEKLSWQKYQDEYEKSNPRGEYLEKRKKNYLKSHPGLNRAMGVTMNNFPEDALQRFNDKYNKERNTYALQKFVIKDLDEDLDNRGQWIDDVEKSQGLYNMALNSKYGYNLKPNLFSRTLAGAEKLVDWIPGVDPFLDWATGKNRYDNILTEQEQKDVTGWDALAFAEYPGQVIANLVAEGLDPNSSTSGETFSGSSSPIVTANPQLNTMGQLVTGAVTLPFTAANVVKSAPAIYNTAKNIGSGGYKLLGKAGDKVAAISDAPIFGPSNLSEANTFVGNVKDAATLSNIGKMATAHDLSTKYIIDPGVKYFSGEEDWAPSFTGNDLAYDLASLIGLRNTNAAKAISAGSAVAKGTEKAIEKNAIPASAEDVKSIYDWFKALGVLRGFEQGGENTDLKRFTDGGNKRKKKKKSKESEDDFQFTSTTQLYKLNDDASRAYAKSDSGKWYEYKSSQVGYDENGNRIMKGTFYPIDSSYDVEKNLVPNVTAMSEDERMAIKRGNIQMPEVKVKAKQKLFDKLAAPFKKIQRDYYEGKLTDEEIQQARDMYNTKYLDNLNLQGTNLRGVGDWLNYKFSSDEDWAKYVEEANKGPKERVYGSINDAYQEIYNNKKRQEDSDKYQQELATLKKENPKAYDEYMFNVAQETKRKNDPNLKPQSAQASDWLWTGAVLGATAFPAATEAMGSLLSYAPIESAPLITAGNALKAKGAYDVATNYGPGMISSALQGNTQDFLYNTYKTASGIIPFTKLGNINAVQTAKDLTGTGEYAGTVLLSEQPDAEAYTKLLKSAGSLMNKQYGGEQDYEEAELTPEEIEVYRRGGYIIEEY
jgi:hypothetical protein